MSNPFFDFSDLSGDPTPVLLAEFLAVNEECPPSPSEVAALEACPVLGTVNIGVGGGFVTVKRVA